MGMEVVRLERVAELAVGMILQTGKHRAARATMALCRMRC